MSPAAAPTFSGQAAAFKQTLLAQFFQDIHHWETGNYDSHRFSFDGVDRSQTIDVAKHVRYLEWFTARFEDVYRAYTRFVDQASRDLFVNLLRYRLAGHLHVRIECAMSHRAAETERFKELFAGAPSSLPTTGMFGGLQHYDQVWNGERFVVDTTRNGLIATLVNGQYFFERDGTRIQPAPGDVVLDGGACTGDTAVVFATAVGPRGRVFAFDPVKPHLDICRWNIAQSGRDNITLVPAGLSDRTVRGPVVEFSDNSYSPGWRVYPGSEGLVPLAKIDDLVADRTIERIDFIKLDVEGSELATLRGAREALRAFRPKLAISIYHKPDDYFEIADFIADLNLGYRLYLDHHKIYDEETVLYAICP